MKYITQQQLLKMSTYSKTHWVKNRRKCDLGYINTGTYAFYDLKKVTEYLSKKGKKVGKPPKIDRKMIVEMRDLIQLFPRTNRTFWEKYRKTHDIGYHRVGRKAFYDYSKILDFICDFEIKNKIFIEDKTERAYDCVNYQSCMDIAAKENTGMNCACLNYKKSEDWRIK